MPDYLPRSSITPATRPGAARRSRTVWTTLRRLPRGTVAICTVAIGTALLAACGSSTGPGDGGAALRLSAPTTGPVTNAYTVATGGRSLACTVPVDASASGSDVLLDSATITYAPLGGGAGRVLPLSSADLATLFGTATVPAGTTHRALITFQYSAVFTARLAIASHTATGGRATASVSTQCVAPIVGTYVLTTINDVRVPAPSSDGTFSADTLTFAADLTYTGRGLWAESGVYGLAFPAAPYGVSGPDSLVLSALLPGYGGGLVTRHGTTLTYTESGCCGRPDHTFRWDSLGSNPVLPPAPAFALSTTDVHFTVAQGAPSPPPDTVQIASATARPLVGLSLTGSSTCPGGVCSTDWLQMTYPESFTPTFITLTVQKTNFPVGTYTGTVFVTSPTVGTNDGVITVTLTITKP